MLVYSSVDIYSIIIKNYVCLLLWVSACSFVYIIILVLTSSFFLLFFFFFFFGGMSFFEGWREEGTPLYSLYILTLYNTLWYAFYTSISILTPASSTNENILTSGMHVLDPVFNSNYLFIGDDLTFVLAQYRIICSRFKQTEICWGSITRQIITTQLFWYPNHRRLTWVDSVFLQLIKIDTSILIVISKKEK